MIRIGISGWRYPGWRGTFYPEGLPQRRELEYASRRMNSIEINGSFYSLQRPEYYRQWYDETPDDFVFAVKGSRFITHMKKLRDVEIPLANFFASGVLRLGRKLGPILWQFPPGWGLDLERFAAFLDVLPRDTAEAAALATQHDERLEGRAWLEAETSQPLRHAFEVRHATCLDPAFIELLRRHKAALVFADTAGRWPYSEDVTADFVYVRLHGFGEIYAGGYDAPQLDWWADRLRAWLRGSQPADTVLCDPSARLARTPRDAYVYFDNDAKVRAPFDAMELMRRFEGPAALPEPPSMQRRSRSPSRSRSRGSRSRS